MSFPRYPRYKDSGVEWLGEVPEHWRVEPLSRQIQRNDGGVWGDDPDGMADTIVLRSTEQTVDGQWQINDPASRKLSASEVESALLIEGDLLVTKSSGSSLHIGKTTLVNREVADLRCCFSNFMQRVRLFPSLLPQLAWYILNNDIARVQFDYLSNSTTGLANLNATMIGQIIVAVPPPPEQMAIATFLESETAKINALIAEQRRLIELLKEKLEAVISHAVTKGLDPHVPMKPSGLEWLGDVPAHWDLITLGRVSAARCDGPFGSGLKSDHYTDLGARVVRLQNIRSGEFADRDMAFIDLDYFQQELTRHDVEEGDLLIAGLGDERNTVGRACVAPPNLGPALVKADCFRFRLDRSRVTPEYAAAQLSVSAPADAGLLSSGSTRSRIPLSVMSTRKLALPPLEEQARIMEFNRAEARRFDALIAEAERAIDLLLERRTALISAAVTGKIDVRGHVAVAEAA